ncbi:hypothetical protein B0H17DRAFT_1075984 [Mycena rosella]|uniref:Extracellular serine-rich protein n=1 Tax=Mycena rosella TaxID=1033263 RepID=A0AAD7DA54_MYCRO|nr:hypothetical protein B0H17DRAFT_1075984 [Mycena rosella]
MSSASTVVVTVGGDLGSPGGLYQFNPPEVSAPSGTTIEFRFNVDPWGHSVRESSFDAPCTPLQGGEDSGGAQPVPTGALTFPTWNFTVTNDQTPLWFFCQENRPISHCTAGMVFAVNANSGSQTFLAFQEAAVALGSPSPSSPLSSTPTSSATDASGTPTQSIAVQPLGEKHLSAAVIAGLVVAALVVLLLCAAALFVHRRRRMARDNAPRPYASGAGSESALLEVADDPRVKTRPDPLVLYEKGTRSEGGASSSTQDIIAMAEEMGLLRGQVQRLALNRQGPGDSEVEDRPPEYGTT